MTIDVVVAWARASRVDAVTEQLVRTVVRTWDGEPVDGGRIHLCPRCGSDRHGRPFVADRRDLGISVAHTTGATAVASVRNTTIGIDMEATARTSFSSIGSVLLHPGERASDIEDLARIWVRKESLVKALGTGLFVDPRAVQVSGPDEPAEVRLLPAAFDDVAVRMQDLTVGASLVGCVSVLSTATPSIRLVEVEPAAASP